MAVCAKCGGRTTRTHRKWYERFLYRQVLRCRECSELTLVRREFTLKPSAYVRCPRCHTLKVSRRIAPDKIDRVIKTVSSMVQGLLGGRLYHCVYCRIQFYDLRHSMKAAAKNEQATPGESVKTAKLAG